MSKSIFKRLISVVLAVSFVSTVLLCPFNFLASAASIPDTYGDNLLSGVSMTAHYSLDGSTRTPCADNGKFSLINDGNLSNEFFIGNPVYFAEEIEGNKVYYTDGSKVFLDLQFDMGEIKTAKAFYMLNHSNSLLATKRYQVYLSTGADNLFFSENMVKDYTNSDSRQENLIVFDQDISARYLGIRILNPVSAQLSDVKSVYTRILEVALLGKAQTLEERYGADQLDGLKMSAEYSVDGGETIIPQSDNSKFSNINDDDEATEFFLGTPKFAEDINGSNVYYTDGSKVFLNLYFNLGTAKKINAFYMCNSSNDLLRNKRYKLYLSKSRADLFDDSKSLVKDYVNTGNDQKNLIAFDEPIEAKYFGIKVLNPISYEIANVNNVYTRINEISLFGEEISPPVIEGENLLPGVAMSVYYSTDGTTRTALRDNGLFKKVNDGDPATEFFTSTPRFAEETGDGNLFHKDGSKVYLDMVFDLEVAQQVNALTLINNSNPSLRTKRFKVFLSNKMSTLFDEGQSLVADITNEGDKEQIDYILDTPQNARFFAIRILNPVASDTVAVAQAFTRLQEIMLFGVRKSANVTVVSEDFTASETVISKLTDSSNLLYNKAYHEIIQYADGVDTTADGERYMLTRPTALTNGVANNAVFFPGSIYFNGDGTPKNAPPYENVSTYTSISYYLGGEAEISEVWIYNHTNKALVNYAYEIYVSDSNLTLFEEDSLVKRYTNTASQTMQKFKFSEVCNGKYFGIKYLVPVPLSSSVSSDNRYVRASQIAAFGTVIPETTTPPYNDLYSRFDYNLVKDRIPEVYGKSGNKYEQIVGNYKNLTDQVFENEIKVEAVKFADWENDSVVLHESGERYVDFIFDFGTTVDIDAVSLTNHPIPERMNNKYSFYASNSREDLFESTSLIEEFNNTSNLQTNLFEYSGSEEYSFFGVRVTDPTCGEVTVTDTINEAFVRLCDLAVFGSYTDPDYKINIVNGFINLTQEEFEAFGNSLIKGVKAPKWFYNSASIPAPWAYVEQSPTLTDGKIDAHADYSGSKYKLSTTDGSNKLDVMYSFEEMYDFSGFTFIGTSDVAGAAYYTGWYQAYVSEDPDELFLPENMVFEYNWLDSGAVRGHNVTFDNYKARGMAFGIRILNPVTTATVWPIPRLTEIALYGEKAVIEILPTNLAVNMPVTAYSESASGKLNEISDSNLTYKEVKKLTDGDSKTYASVKTTGTKVHLLYNLCNDVLLTDVKLESSGKKYKVYASDDIGDVWEEDSLIYSYNGQGTNGKALTGKLATKKYRYVRFEITDFSSPLKIYEASVIGGDNQLLKYKQISRTFSYGNISLSTYNYKTKERNYISSDAYFYKLFDNDIYTSICIEGGMHNEIAIDMTITFDDVKNIDNISLYFPDMLDGYNPTKLELYTSENYSEFSNGIPEGTEPIKVFDTLPENGVYSVDFKPQFSRIMVARFVCGNQEYDGYEDRMCFALNEVKIMGTSVVGIQTDEQNDTLLTFTDKATGIKAHILKYDNNDIFTEVTGIKVTKAPVTLKQKQSLANHGYLKVIDETVYDVQFTDRLGNVITDLGGRDYRISLPFDNKKYLFTMIASVNNNNCEVLDSMIIDDLVYSDKSDFQSTEYMLVSFASSEDSYFDNLNVVVPEGEEQITPPGVLEDGQSNIADGYTEPDYSLDTNYPQFSPETGEKTPPLAVITLSLFALSVLCLTALSKRNAFKKIK